MSDNQGKTSQIIFTVELDEQNLPEKISWEATRGNDRDKSPCKSIMLSIWDHEDQNTLRFDLWTKDMRVDEMTNHFLQTLITMGETYKNATGNEQVLEEVQRSAQKLGEVIGAFESKRQQQ